MLNQYQLLKKIHMKFNITLAAGVHESNVERDEDGEKMN